MMSRGNIVRCVPTTLVTLATLAGLCTPDVLGRQPEPSAGVPSAAAPTEALTRPPVDPAEAMAVFSAVEARVREWRVETGAALPDAAARVGAACLEIRLDGKLLGRGAAEGVGAAASALAAAMRGADERLPVPADALREQNARLAAERAIIGLELAGVLVPFDARSAAQVDALLAPGLDGVAVRIGDRVGLVFPAEMLADGFTPSAALGLAASRTGDASLSVLEPSMLREQHGAVLYRFRTVHVATTLPGQAPIFLFRGGKPVPETSIDQASLRGMAGGIASHLAREVLEAFDDARGIATSPPLRPEVAGWDPFTRGLVARALAMHALVAEEGATRIASRYASRALCESLAASNLQTPEAAASLVNARAALCRATNTPFTEAALQIDRLVANPAFRLDPAAIARSPQAGWIALALAEAGAISPQRSDLAAEVIAAAFASEDAPPLVTAMPFLGEAEMLVAANRAAFSPGGVPSLPHAAAFAELREHLAASLYVDAASPDFAGGFVFAGSPYPTWHTARPAAFLAQMLGSRVMTPPDRSMVELLATLRTARFLRQLCVDESTAWMYPDPEGAMWGVRLSTWDPRLRPEASAVTLIATLRTLESLEVLRAATTPGTLKKPDKTGG
jgi:hypothetical protein